MERMKILEARDQRVDKIEELIHENKVVLSLRVNYPGNEKDNTITRKVINEINDEIKSKFTIIYSQSFNCGEGLVYIYFINSCDPINMKEMTINIENNHPLGRLVDIDVYYKSIKSISRSDLNYNSRTCFMCNQDAFKCIRNQTHSLTDLQSYFRWVVEQYES